MILDDLQYLQILQMRAERTVGPIESVCMYVNCIYAARLSASTLVAPHTSLDTRWASVYIRVHMLRAQYETDAYPLPYAQNFAFVSTLLRELYVTPG